MKPYPLHNLAGGCPSSRHNHMTLAIALSWLLARSGFVAGSMLGVDQTGAA
jgi:hypothetical protein